MATTADSRSTSSRDYPRVTSLYSAWYCWSGSCRDSISPLIPTTVTVHWLLALAPSYPFWHSSFPEDRRHLNHGTLASGGQMAALADLIRMAPITTEVTMVEVTAGPMVDMGADIKIAEDRRR